MRTFSLLPLLAVTLIFAPAAAASAPAPVSHIPSGGSTPPIPVGSTPGGTTIAVSPSIGTTNNQPTITGGGVTVSTPVGKSGASVGGSVSTNPSGPAVGGGVTIPF